MLAPAQVALLALTCVRAEILNGHGGAHSHDSFLLRQSAENTVKALGSGCLYGGRWYAEGASVHVHDACLQCACAHGALSCARTSCAAAPHPPPRRCALLHRRDACCPELHCADKMIPDGVKSLELAATARLEEEQWDVATPATPGHACVEEGGVFAAGSALSARAACEQCFCLRGARRCVRPRCLPPPPGCSPRPAAGVCCPQRYYCTPTHTNATTSATSKPTHGKHDCLVDGEWVSEGERMQVAGADNCTQCFCLRGAARCQPLECAPALRGCAPLLRPGQCCPHQYQCPHRILESSVPVISSNSLMPPVSYDKRSLVRLLASPAPLATTKVKRKTSDIPPTVSQKTKLNTTSTTSARSETTTVLTVRSGTEPNASTEPPTVELTTTEQPDGSVRVIINGTINCTAELSSTLVNVSSTDATLSAPADVQPQVPATTSGPLEVITGGSVDSFTVSVSSSLRANTSFSGPSAPAASVPSLISSNMTKKNKEDYDYDYMEPTLPPSLPNLKIIPFVAADAVVDENVSSKEESLPYPVLEREDKFPVYYASVEQKETPFASRREDVMEPAYPLDLPAPSPTAVPSFTPESHKPERGLFSPPVETEGGFIPKGPGIIEEYYAVYPSTPPPVPHLTTSMQINPATSDSEDCLSESGERVPSGGVVRLQCTVCSCHNGRLVCSTPDPCCLTHSCSKDNSTTKPRPTSTPHPDIATNITEDTPPIQSDLIPFDPPADRTVVEYTPAASSPSPTTIAVTAVTDTASSVTNAITETAHQETTPTTPSSTTESRITTSIPKLRNDTNNTDTQTQEYEDEDDDEGFSFGSVLKLLLSETYDTTTVAATKNKPTPSPMRKPAPVISHSPSTMTTTRRTPPVTTPTPFIPLPHQPYMPSRKGQPHGTVNRIDHLVLGEATAIKKTPTFRPTSSLMPPKKYTVSSSSPRPTNSPRPTTSPRTTTSPLPAPAQSPPPPSGPPSSGGVGLLKLAGCNIYGRMYRVGRIIAELSTPCQECRCTELGVQCAPLRC